MSINEVLLAEIRDGRGNRRNDILPLIKNDDDQFLVTNPGESYYFQYSVTPQVNMETTVFLSSRGYCTECLRGERLSIWIPAFVLALGFFYSTPIHLGKTAKRLKDFLFVKGLVPALGWSLLTVIYPVKHGGIPLGRSGGPRLQ